MTTQIQAIRTTSLTWKKGIPLAQGYDINALYDSGHYDVREPTNGPDTGQYHILNLVGSQSTPDNLLITQLAMRMDDGVMSLRVHSSGSWGAWGSVGGGGGAAADVTYDNVVSGLVADDVQEAIDELAALFAAITAAEVSYDNGTSGLAADDVQEAIDELQVEKEPFGLITPNDQTESYILLVDDAGKTIRMNLASGGTLTVPPNSSQAIPVDSRIEVLVTGAGEITVVEGGGVTVDAPDGFLGPFTIDSALILIKEATDSWRLVTNSINLFDYVAPTSAAEAGGEITLDVDNGRVLFHKRTMAGNEELQLPDNMPDGSTIYFRCDPDGNTLTYETGYKGSNGATPGAITVETLFAIIRDGAEYLINIVGQNYGP